MLRSIRLRCYACGASRVRVSRWRIDGSNVAFGKATASIVSVRNMRGTGMLPSRLPTPDEAVRRLTDPSGRVLPPATVHLLSGTTEPGIYA